MKIVKLAGGLGNQMFQYAFGLMLMKKYKNVYFDKKNYKSIKDRKYELGLFPNLKIKFKQKHWFIPYHKSDDKNLFFFDEKLLNAHFNEYYTGYFQNEKYFKSVEQDVRKAFEFPKFDNNDKINKEIVKHIKQCENPVFIHLRRGDYVNLQGWLLDKEYYIKSVKYIKQHVKNPTFFLFSDADENYIKNNFKIGCKYEYIGTHNSDNNQDFRDMHLMSLCRHAIIANSSFYFLSAWLQKNKFKMVCMPKPWTHLINAEMCENWIKIEHK